VRVYYVTIFVKDFDEAKDWYTSKCGFHVIEDNTYGDFRWLVVGPEKNFPYFGYHKANEEQMKRVGSQLFVCIFLFLIYHLY